MLADKLKLLQEQVEKLNYFPHLWKIALDNNDIALEEIELKMVSDKQATNIANDFWLILPDNSSIRREPFFLVCEIAEHIFN